MNDMISPNFAPGILLKRSHIHNEYGGNRQSGISLTKKSPSIFIFSGKTGERHGYQDQWESPEVFSYTGAGQDGDMKFEGGNLQLRDHVANGKRVFLFVSDMRSFVRFECELEFFDYDYFISQDTTGRLRTAIKFFFKRRGHKIGYLDNKTLAVLDQERSKPFSPKMDVPTEKLYLVNSRVGQDAYRKSILHRWKFRCAVTNFSKSETLIASHIVPWKIGNNFERLDVHNGILLSPTYDALFDRGFISFEDTGKIILSDTLKECDHFSIGVSGKERIRELSSENHGYLQRHRDTVFKT